MNEFDVLQLAIDFATKHGKHNQKAHGRRGGAAAGEDAIVKPPTPKAAERLHAASAARIKEFDDTNKELMGRIDELVLRGEKYQNPRLIKQAKRLSTRLNSLLRSSDGKQVQEARNIVEESGRVVARAKENKRITASQSETVGLAYQSTERIQKQIREVQGLNRLAESMLQYATAGGFD